MILPSLKLHRSSISPHFGEKNIHEKDPETSQIRVILDLGVLAFDYPTLRLPGLLLQGTQTVSVLGILTKHPARGTVDSALPIQPSTLVVSCRSGGRSAEERGPGGIGRRKQKR